MDTLSKVAYVLRKYTKSSKIRFRGAVPLNPIQCYAKNSQKGEKSIFRFFQQKNDMLALSYFTYLTLEIVNLLSPELIFFNVSTYVCSFSVWHLIEHKNTPTNILFVTWVRVRNIFNKIITRWVRVQNILINIRSISFCFCFELLFYFDCFFVFVLFCFTLSLVRMHHCFITKKNKHTWSCWFCL